VPLAGLGRDSPDEHLLVTKGPVPLPSTAPGCIARRGVVPLQVVTADTFAVVVNALLEERDLGLLLSATTLVQVGQREPGRRYSAPWPGAGGGSDGKGVRAPSCPACPPLQGLCARNGSTGYEGAVPRLVKVQWQHSKPAVPGLSPLCLPFPGAGAADHAAGAGHSPGVPVLWHSLSLAAGV
jgi:hypothetical protein